MNSITLQCSAVDVIVNKKHPNKLSFTASICYVDKPSDQAPNGTNGKFLVLTKTGTENALDSMALMGINCSMESNYTQHDPREKVGIVEKAWIDGDLLKCQGFFYAQDYPDVAWFVKNAVNDLGFSIEATDIQCTQDETTVYATSFVFTGLCALFAKSAAYTQTCIDYLAANKQIKEGNKMTPEQLQQLQTMIEAMTTKFEASVAEIKASVDEVKSEVATVKSEVKAEADKTNTQVEALALGLVETKEAIKASKEVAEPVVEPVAVQASTVVAPTVLAAGQAVVPNGNIAQPVDEMAQKIKEINASAMSPLEKSKAITKLKYSV